MNVVVYLWRMFFGSPRQKASTLCYDTGHTSIEQKKVAEHYCFRCLDCGVEEAFNASQWNYGTVPGDRTKPWTDGLKKQEQRNIAAAAKDALTTAFHQDSAQAALVDWREKHVQ